jgi:hypothetical protein
LWCACRMIVRIANNGRRMDRPEVERERRRARRSRPFGL